MGGARNLPGSWGARLRALSGDSTRIQPPCVPEMQHEVLYSSDMLVAMARSWLSPPQGLGLPHWLCAVAPCAALGACPGLRPRMHAIGAHVQGIAYSVRPLRAAPCRSSPLQQRS